MESFLTTDQLAARLGIQRTSVHRYRTRGDIPEPDQYVGRTPLWAEASVEAWLKERPGHGWRKGKKRQTPAEPG